MKSESVLINEFTDICEDIESLLDGVTDMVLDSYKGTTAEKLALNYLTEIKKLSAEIELRISKAESQEPKQSLKTLDSIEVLIEKRNSLLKELGILV
jgi:hypothetical protein